MKLLHLHYEVLSYSIIIIVTNETKQGGQSCIKEGKLKNWKRSYEHGKTQLKVRGMGSEINLKEFYLITLLLDIFFWDTIYNDTW